MRKVAVTTRNFFGSESYHQENASSHPLYKGTIKRYQRNRHEKKIKDKGIRERNLSSGPGPIGIRTVEQQSLASPQIALFLVLL
jgi:hypothetical protein